jgi:imidazolonepropionase-like amidohydrolase
MQVLTARWLIDGTGAPPLADAAVVVDDAGRLAWVGPRLQRPPVSPQAPHRDLGARALLPGIVDAHVHLALDGGRDPVGAIQSIDDATLLADMQGRAARMLAAGITTARDCGARGGLDVALRSAIAAGRVAGPRLVVSGSPLTTEGGHCYFLGGCTAHGVARVRAAAERQLGVGADWVKVMVSGGRITPGSDATRCQFTRAEVRAAAGAAHAAGRRLAAHAHSTASIALAVAAGADSVEHCAWADARDRVRYAPRVAAAMAERWTYACVTPHPRYPAIAKRHEPGWLEQRLGTIVAMRAAGIPLAFGSDGGVPLRDHADWFGGLIWLARAGLAPLAVIRAATSGAAACIGLGDAVGTLTAGKWADLIAVDGNPVDDLERLARVDWVMQGGRVIRDDAAPA